METIIGRKFKAIIVRDDATAKDFEDLMNGKWKIVTSASLQDGVMFLLTDK
jgi:hypothetical protein